MIERKSIMMNQNEHDPRQDYTSFYEEPNSENGSSNYVNIYSDPGQKPKKSGGGRAFLKVLAALAALAIVSVSSIEMYKLFGTKDSKADAWSKSAEEELQIETSDESSTEEESSESGSKVNPAAPSWISSAAPEDALTIPEIVEKALPSVVGISSTYETERSMQSYWGFSFYGGDGGTQTQQFSTVGTGIVMSADGYVVTNAHCIYDNESEYKAGKAVAVSVVMGDENETEYDAQIVGYDLQTDLAVLKIDATGLTPAEFGDSDQLQVGEMVVAIGNPLGFELFGTTTCGIVSALNREITIDDKHMTLIQTDAAINSGNSGGPLLNGYGQVIGINSVKMGSTYGSASVEGLGFAIPISDAKDIIDSLINNGYVTGRPQLGITCVEITEADAERYNMPQGALVYAVGEGSAAEQAGIKQGDVITKVDGQEITTPDELNEIKNQHDAGETITLTVWRSGMTEEIPIVLQEMVQED